MNEYNFDYFSLEDFNNIIATVESRKMIDFTPVENPKAFILGGQSGAGKSALCKVITSEMGKNVILIDGDTFRSLHPHNEQLDRIYGDDSVSHKSSFSNKMIEELIDRFSKKGYNLIIEGTLRTSTAPLETAEKLTSRGYEVELLVMAVKPQISYYSTVLRYEEMMFKGKRPRATHKEHHDSIVQSIGRNLETLYLNNSFKNIRVYDRQYDCLYEKVKNPTTNPKYVLENVLYGAWSDEEKEMISKTCDDIIELMANRNYLHLESFIKEKNIIIQNIENI